MNQSRMLLAGLIMVMMGSAFAVDIRSNATEVFNISQPSIFTSNQVDQNQADQLYKNESLDRAKNQNHQVRQENAANVSQSLEENSYLARNGNFLAVNSSGRSGAAADSRDDCPFGQVDESAESYDLNRCRTTAVSNDYSKYVYYKQSVTVVNPNSPLYEGQTSNAVTASVTTGQQVANRNANQNVLFFCTAGDRVQTAEAFKKVQSVDLSVWKSLNDFNKCQAWAVAPK